MHCLQELQASIALWKCERPDAIELRIGDTYRGQWKRLSQLGRSVECYSNVNLFASNEASTVFHVFGIG